MLSANDLLAMFMKRICLFNNNLYQAGDLGMVKYNGAKLCRHC
ncbi:MAG: hypothetical protein JWR09_2714 [Mucilaginibacter sp.]|nr:hypothetical protein [Mucilaginibacter sp.]